MFLHSADLTEEVENAIMCGRNRAFPNHQSEYFYFKQIPYGILFKEVNNKIVGQCSVIYRCIRINETPYRIFGVCDLWVDEEFQNNGIASELLDELFSLSYEKSIDFNILIADRFDLYKKNNFHPFSANAQWLRINNHYNYGVASEYINDVMIRSINKIIKEDIINLDFLGEMF